MDYYRVDWAPFGVKFADSMPKQEVAHLEVELEKIVKVLLCGSPRCRWLIQNAFKKCFYFRDHQKVPVGL
jgi:hypothetical protein